MGKDWDAVARAIDGRLASLEMTQAELSARAHVAPETIRELRHNLRPRRRNPRTLAAISQALGWEPGHLSRLLGDIAGPPDERAAGPGELEELRKAYADLAGRVEAIERRLDTR